MSDIGLIGLAVMGQVRVWPVMRVSAQLIVLPRSITVLLAAAELRPQRRPAWLQNFCI